MIKAVIFDMDGVLIDSEIVYLDHMYEKLKHKYPDLSRETLFPVVGSTTKMTMDLLSEIIEEDRDSQEFQEMYFAIWADLRPDYFAILRKEVPELLKELRRRGYLVALASSTSRAGIEEVLTTCRLKGDFDYIISGEEFKESKPNPEIYLHTADALQCSPEECLVVEDSTYGITAGHRAGMNVVSIIDERFQFDRSLADYTIHNLIELLEILKNLEK